MRVWWRGWIALACLAGCSRDVGLPPLPGAGTLYGRVVYAVPGEVQPSVAAGAPVQLLGSSLSTRTGDDGRFVLDGISQNGGSLLFRVDASGSGTFDRQKIVSLQDVGAGPGRQVSLGDVLVGVNAQMHGRVLLGDRVAQPGGQGGTTVFVPAAPFSTSTHDDGTWTLEDLPEGAIQISAFHPAYAATALGGIVLGSGQDYAVKDLVLAPTPGTAQSGTIGGSVAFVPPSANVSSALVTASTVLGKSFPGPVQGDGTFRLTQLDPDLYTVTVSLAGYTSASVPNVLLPSGQEVDLPVIVLGTAPPLDAGTPGDAGSSDGGTQPPGTPIANAGPAGAVRVGGAFSLDGTGSQDPADERLVFHWVQTAGAPVTLSANDSILAATPGFTAPATPQNLSFSLTVSNSARTSAPATTQVAVVDPPIARVTPAALTLLAGEQATLDGSASSDPTGSALSYAWSVQAGGLTLSASSGKQVSVTATASGAGAVRLVVSNGAVSSDPFDVSVGSGAPVISVSAGTSQAVGTGAAVLLQGSATSSDPNDVLGYTWSQTSGPAVSLSNPRALSASFQAPAQPQTLDFQLTAADDAGFSGSSNVQIQVLDLTRPAVIAMVPSVDGGMGPWSYASATFDKALDPTSVTAANVFIADATGTPVPAQLAYDVATATVTVSPNSPLVFNALYTFTVGAVTDDTPQHNAHLPQSVSYFAQVPQWDFWASAVENGAGSSAPNPGIAVTPSEVDVFAYRYQEGGCATGTWILNPDAGGVLADQAECLSLGPYGVPPGRKGLVINGIVYAMVAATCGGACGSAGVILKENAAGWTTLTAGPQEVFTDGVSLLGAECGYNCPLTLGDYDPTCGSSWCQTTVDSPLVYDSNHMSGAGSSGRTVLVGSRSQGNRPSGPPFYLVAFESSGGAWTQLDGGLSFGGIDYSQVDISNRVAFAHGDPVIAYAAQNPSPAVSVAAYASASQSWKVFPNASNGTATEFDLVARGDTAWLAVITSSQLNLRRLDLGGAAPAFVDVVGPAGTSLNQSASCVAGHPELAVTKDSVWLTWHESCAPGAYQVLLRRMF